MRGPGPVPNSRGLTVLHWALVYGNGEARAVVALVVRALGAMR